MIQECSIINKCDSMRIKECIIECKEMFIREFIENVKNYDYMNLWDLLSEIRLHLHLINKDNSN